MGARIGQQEQEGANSGSQEREHRDWDQVVAMEVARNGPMPGVFKEEPIGFLIVFSCQV